MDDLVSCQGSGLGAKLNDVKKSNLLHLFLIFELQFNRANLTL
jgi:hypothetical protein